MHGARGGAPHGNRNAHKHGRYGREAIETRRMVAELIRDRSQAGRDGVSAHRAGAASYRGEGPSPLGCARGQG